MDRSFVGLNSHRTEASEQDVARNYRLGPWRDIPGGDDAWEGVMEVGIGWGAVAMTVWLSKNSQRALARSLALRLCLCLLLSLCLSLFLSLFH